MWTSQSIFPHLDPRDDDCEGFLHHLLMEAAQELHLLREASDDEQGR